MNLTEAGQRILELVDTAQAGLESALLKVQELDLENLRLQRRLQPLIRLEMAVRNCAQVDMVARELLTVMDGDGNEPA